MLLAGLASREPPIPVLAKLGCGDGWRTGVELRFRTGDTARSHNTCDVQLSPSLSRCAHLAAPGSSGGLAGSDVFGVGVRFRAPGSTRRWGGWEGTGWVRGGEGGVESSET
eukprot:Sspe_Gene.85548::Locus_56293_Transcript_1_1_Confidence_1.000_Length_1159::g.85548::m.85548